MSQDLSTPELDRSLPPGGPAPVAGTTAGNAWLHGPAFVVTWIGAGLLTLVMVTWYVLLYVPLEAAAIADALWTVGVLVVVFTGCVLVLRRVAIAAALALVLLVGSLFALAPRLADERTGDPEILADLSMFTGYRDLSVAVIDLNAAQRVRLANIGSTPTTRFEVGSVSKALTGLVIADAVQRGELSLGDPLSTYLPINDAAGAITMRQLVTHRSGLPEEAAGTVIHGAWAWPLGLNFFRASRAQVLAEVSSSQRRRPGSDGPGRRIGTFWMTSRTFDGRLVTWHNGGSGGYSSYVAFDRQQQKAVIVLSDVARGVDGIGERLLANN